MSRSPLDRRTLLRGAAGVAIALPFLEAMRPRRASAAPTGPAPKRLVLWFTPNGTVYNQWKPTGTSTDFTLSPILAPLAARKGKIIVVDNMEMKRGGPGDGHQQGMGHLWTGIDLLPGDIKGGSDDPPAGFSSGPSIDQVVAKEVGKPERPSIDLAVQPGGAKDMWSRMSYAAKNQPVDPEINPWAAFADVFADAQSPDKVALAKLQAERKTVVDAVRGSYQSLLPALGKEDRTRMEKHLEAVQTLQKKIDAATVKACKAPDLGPAPGSTQDAVLKYVKANENFPTVGKLHMDILAYALACDLTRVATLQWSRSVGDPVFTWLGISGQEAGHHQLSHKDSEADAKAKLVQINTWYAKQFDYFLGALDAFDEGNGTTLLDNTAVVWGNELSEGGSHGSNPGNFVIGGSCGGYFKTGRWLDTKKTPHNNLLVSLANAMGMPIKTFGRAEWCTGPLAGLTG